MLMMVKINMILLCSTENYIQIPMINQNGEEYKKRMSTYVKRNHFAVQQKLMQRCKSTILKSKKNTEEHKYSILLHLPFLLKWGCLAGGGLFSILQQGWLLGSFWSPLRCLLRPRLDHSFLGNKNPEKDSLLQNRKWSGKLGKPTSISVLEEWGVMVNPTTRSPWANKFPSSGLVPLSWKPSVTEPQNCPQLLLTFSFFGTRFYLFMSSLLHGLSLVAASRGYSLVPVGRILVAVASLVVEHRL